MKLCWKNLCKIKIVKYYNIEHPGGRLGFYDGVPKHKMLQHYVELGNYCDYCGLEFIKGEKQKRNYCDKKCSKLHVEWKKKWNKRAKQLKRFITPKPLPKIKKQKLKEINNPKWTGGSQYLLYSI